MRVGSPHYTICCVEYGMDTFIPKCWKQPSRWGYLPTSLTESNSPNHSLINKNKNMRTYENGYLPKIEYWTSKLVEAVKAGNIYEIDHIHNKLDFFIQKQFDLNIKNKK